jgi:hypothetical protein
LVSGVAESNYNLNVALEKPVKPTPKQTLIPIPTETPIPIPTETPTPLPTSGETQTFPPDNGTQPFSGQRN